MVKKGTANLTNLANEEKEMGLRISRMIRIKERILKFFQSVSSVKSVVKKSYSPDSSDSRCLPLFLIYKIQ